MLASIALVLAVALGSSAAAPAGAAANCQFVLGFKVIHDQIPIVVGDCVDNESHNPVNGDALQHTSTGGLLVWRKSDNWTAFTDGYHTWVNGPNGLQERLNTERFPFEHDQNPPAGTCATPHNTFTTACPLGPVDANGATVKGRITSLDRPLDRDAWEVTITGSPKAMHITLQDLWYSMGVQVWQKATQTKIDGKLFRAAADDYHRRLIQFVMPEIIVKTLDPGTYTIFVYAGPYADDPTQQPIPGENATFDPSRGYTLRVALGDPACSTVASGSFQLGLTIQPAPITQFSLITFNAFIDPPYTDLYDFDWSVDGKQLSVGDRQTYQIAASALGGSGDHTVSVNARGVRPYPDSVPVQPFTPPSMTTQCTFHIGS
jgi:hypothetical protein